MQHPRSTPFSPFQKSPRLGARLAAAIFLFGLGAPVASADDIELQSLPDSVELPGEWGRVVLLPAPTTAVLPGVSRRSSDRTLAPTFGAGPLGAGPLGGGPAAGNSGSSPFKLIGRTLDQGGMALAVASHGDRCYVGTSGSLAVYDVSNPSAPSLGNEIDELTCFLVREGSVLGAVQGCAGELVLYDLADPDMPVETSRLVPPPGFFYEDLDLGAPGGNTVVATGYGYLDSFGWCALLQVVDVTNPGAPVVAGTLLGVLNYFGDLVRDGDTVYVSSADGLLLLDISFPAIFSLLSSVPGTYLSRGIDYDSGYVFLSGNGLEVVDVSDSSNPALVGQTSGIYTSDVQVSGAYAYEANDDDRALWVFDISDPTTPFLAAEVSGQGIVDSLDVEGTRAYLPDAVFGLLVMDISTPTAPALVSTTSTGARPMGIDVEGSLAAVTTNFAQVRTFDVSDPALPVALGSWEQAPDLFSSTTFQQGGLDLSGDLVITGDWARDGSKASLQTYGVANPSVPTHEGGMEIVGGLTPVVRQLGNLVYSGGNDLQIIDVSDPTSPVQVATGPSFTGTVADMVIAGQLGFVSSDLGDVVILDLSNPLAPVELSRVNVDGLVAGIALDGTVLGIFWEDYFTGVAFRYSGGVVFYDVSDPSLPVQVGSVDKPSSVYFSDAGGGRMAAADGRFFVVGRDRMLVIDATDPSAPYIVSAYPDVACPVNFRAGGYSSVKLAGGLLYLAGHDGLEVLRYRDVGVVLIPQSDPLTVPQGATFQYDVEVTNYSSQTQTVWGRIAPPFGSGVALPTPRPLAVLLPGESVHRTLSLRVPVNAALGAHTLGFRVGTAAAGELDRTQLVFQVVP
jgi:hypothetical protein